MPTPDDFVSALPIINPRPRKPGTFTPGNTLSRGRMKGSVNRITKDLKLGLLDAAESLGEDGNGKNGLTGYLRFVGANHPKAFCHMLGKVLPLQINGTGLASDAPPVAINIICVPSGHFLSEEDIAHTRGEPVQPPQIEHAPQIEPQPEPEPEPEHPRITALKVELNNLSYDELLARARECGLVDNVE